MRAHAIAAVKFLRSTHNAFLWPCFGYSWLKILECFPLCFLWYLARIASKSLWWPSSSVAHHLLLKKEAKRPHNCQQHRKHAFSYDQHISCRFWSFTENPPTHHICFHHLQRYLCKEMDLSAGKTISQFALFTSAALQAHSLLMFVFFLWFWFLCSFD